MIAVDFCTDIGLESGPIRRGKLLGRFFTMRCKNSVRLHLYTQDACWKRNMLVEVHFGVLTQECKVLWSVIHHFLKRMERN